MPSETITLRLVATDLASGNISKAIAGIDKMAQRGGILGSVFQGVGLSIGQMFNPVALVGRAFDTVTDIIGDSIDAASALAETQAKVGQVYKTTGADVLAWGEDAAEAMGLSTQKALEAHATFGNFTQALGATEEEAMQMSGSLVQLAADLASFNNANIEDVLVSLRSGMAGEAEPMRRLGADVSAARIELELMEMGVAKVNSRYSESDKIIGRYRAIMEDTAKAQGDFARTSEGLANTQRTLSANIEDLMADVGAAIVPIATAITDIAIDAINAVEGLVEGIGDLADAANDFLDPGRDTAATIGAIAKRMGGREGMSLRTYAASLRMTGEETTALRNELKFLGVAEVNQRRLMEQLAEVSAESGAEMGAVVGAALEMTKALRTNSFTVASTEDRIAMWRTELGKVYEQFDLLNPYIEDSTDATEKNAVTVSEATSIYLDWIRTTVVGQQHIKALGDSYDVLSGKENDATLATQRLATGLEDAAGEGVAVMDQATDSLIKSMKDLPPSMHKAIVDGKETVRAAMTELRWAMEHPFAEEKYANWLEARADKANEKLTAALQRGQVDAAREAAALRAAIYAELSGLNDQTYHLRVEVEYDPLSSIRAPKRAAGGPVYAGQSYVVGERGPEMFTPTGSGSISPGVGGSFVYAPTFSSASPAEAQRFAMAITPYLERERRRIA